MDWGRAVVALYNGGNTSDSITSCLGKNDIRAWSITPGSDSRLPLSILQSSTGKDSLDNILGTDGRSWLKTISLLVILRALCLFHKVAFVHRCFEA